MILLAGQPTTVPPDEPGGEVPEQPQPVVNFPLSWQWSAPWLSRTWNLVDPASPVVKLRGATGTGQANPAHRWAESPTIDGATWEGVRVERGSLFMLTWVHAGSSEEFLAEHAAFMQALDPRRESLLRITRPDGEWRENNCRYESGADLAIELDPVAMGSARYGITWALADPYWRGPQIVEAFDYTQPLPFFPGPPFNLAPNRSLSTALVTNPGDVESFPTWHVEGPLTSFSVGVGDAVVVFGASLGVGQYVDVDMSPGAKTITDHTGADRWDSVTDWSDAPIPAGDSELVTSLVGSGPGSSVTLTFTPRYRSAW